MFSQKINDKKMNIPAAADDVATVVRELQDRFLVFPSCFLLSSLQLTMKMSRIVEKDTLSRGFDFHVMDMILYMNSGHSSGGINKIP